MKTCLSIFIILVLFASAPTATAQNGYDLYQRALQMERVEGDLQGAIALYEQIVDQYSSNRELAATALLQVGRSYMRLGQPEEARRAFLTVREQFADQRQIVAAVPKLETADEENVPPTDAEHESGIVLRRLDLSAGAFEALGGEPVNGGRQLLGVDWSTGDLAIYEAQTGDVRRLTNKGSWQESSAFALFPALSPDERRVAYLWYNEDEEPELRVMNLDGSDERIAYAPSAVWVEPYGWAANGRRLIVGSNSLDGASQIAVVDIQSGTATILKTFDWQYPMYGSVSPDGRFLVYDISVGEDEPERDLMILPLDGSGERALIAHPADDLMAEWTPSGDGLLFLSNRSGTYDYWFVPVNETGAAGPPLLVKSNVGFISPIGFTEDDQFYYSRKISNRNMFTVTLTEDKDAGEPVQISRLFAGRSGLPAWSRDGRKIAYISRRTFIAAPGSQNIVIYDVATEKQRVLPVQLQYVSGDVMSWSPDGRYLVLVSRTTGGAAPQIVRIDVESGEVETIIEGRPTEYLYDAQYDAQGRHIIYGRREFSPRRDFILSYDLQTGSKSIIYSRTDDASLNDLAASPIDERLAFVLDSPTINPGRIMVLAPGQEPRVIYLGRGDGLNDLAWSRDGQFVYSIPDEGDRVHKISIGSGNAETLDIGMKDIKAISVDSSSNRLAVSAGESAREIWVMEGALSGIAERR